MTFFRDRKINTVQIAKAIPSKKSNTGGIRTPDFKLHGRVTVISSMILAQKQTQRPNRIEYPQIYAISHSKHSWKTDGAGKPGYPHVED
jgi:hypothetical protein